MVSGPITPPATPDPYGTSGASSAPISWGQGSMPPGTPLPPNDPWVQALMQMCPQISEIEAQMYASRLRDNMFQALQDQIKRDTDAHEKEKQVEKEMNPDD